MNYDPLLYGKDGTEKIVGLQVHDGSAELFIVQEDGSVKTEVRPNKFWLLSPEKVDNSWVRMRGDLPYKWGKQFDTRESFVKTRSFTKKYGVFSIWDAKESCMVNKGITYFKGMKPSDLSVLSFDLETTNLEPTDPSAKILLISNTFRSTKGNITRKLFCYDQYKSQEELLSSWSKWVVEMDPMVLTGHNVLGFDLNYMITIAGQELKIGKNGTTLEQSNYQSHYRIDQSRGLDYKNVNCYGREIIDTMLLAYKYDAASKKYDSYRLKRIIEIEGLQKENRQFYDAGEIRFKYKDPIEWEKIKQYCIHDADDALALFELMAPPYFYICQYVPKSFQSIVCGATGSQINSLMVRAYLQNGHSLPKADEAGAFQGALSDGFAGIYNNCLKWDVASLYPSIMREYKIYDKNKDPNAAFLTLVEYFSIERLKNKKLAKETGDKFYDDLQNAQKIFANSMYGFMGAPGLNFNSIKNAAFVTEKGREILKKAILWATGIDYAKRIDA